MTGRELDQDNPDGPRDPQPTSRSGPRAPPPTLANRDSGCGQPGVLGVNIADLDPDHYRATGRAAACPDTSSSPWPRKEHHSGIIRRAELPVDGEAQQVTVETAAVVQVAGAQQDPAAQNVTNATISPFSVRCWQSPATPVQAACRRLLARLRWFFGHLPRRAGRVHPSAGRRHDTLRRHGRRARPQYPAVCRCPYAYAARACQPDLHPGRLPLDDQGRSLPRLTSRRRCARLWRSILFPSSPDPVNPKPAGYSLSRRGLQRRRSGAKPHERRDRATAWVVRGQSP